jgi:hypothetical protein
MSAQSAKDLICDTDVSVCSWCFFSMDMFRPAIYRHKKKSDGHAQMGTEISNIKS